MGLRLGACAGAVEQQHVARLLGGGPADVPLDQVAGQIRRPRPARAGDPVTVRDEQTVGHHGLIGKLVQKVLIVIPAHAGGAPLHQTDPAEDEAAGAQADEPCPRLRRPVQVTLGGRVDLPTGVQHAPHDDHIVELRRIDEAARGRDQGPAA